MKDERRGSRRGMRPLPGRSRGPCERRPQPSDSCWNDSDDGVGTAPSTHAVERCRPFNADSCFDLERGAEQSKCLVPPQIDLCFAVHEASLPSLSSKHKFKF